MVVRTACDRSGSTSQQEDTPRTISAVDATPDFDIDKNTHGIRMEQSAELIHIVNNIFDDANDDEMKRYFTNLYHTDISRLLRNHHAATGTGSRNQAFVEYGPIKMCISQFEQRNSELGVSKSSRPN